MKLLAVFYGEPCIKFYYFRSLVRIVFLYFTKLVSQITVKKEFSVYSKGLQNILFNQIEQHKDDIKDNGTKLTKIEKLLMISKD